MKINVKKVIAREFLIMISVIIIGLVSYGYVLANNFYYNRTYSKLTKEYYKLRKPYLSKLDRQLILTDKYIYKFKSYDSERYEVRKPIKV